MREVQAWCNWWPGRASGVRTALGAKDSSGRAGSDVVASTRILNGSTLRKGKQFCRWRSKRRVNFAFFGICRFGPSCRRGLQDSDYSSDGEEEANGAAEEPTTLPKPRTEWKPKPKPKLKSKPKTQDAQRRSKTETAEEWRTVKKGARGVGKWQTQTTKAKNLYIPLTATFQGDSMDGWLDDSSTETCKGGETEDEDGGLQGDRQGCGELTYGAQQGGDRRSGEQQQQQCGGLRGGVQRCGQQQSGVQTDGGQQFEDQQRCEQVHCEQQGEEQCLVQQGGELPHPGNCALRL